jgi:predicted DNA-binding transcriptional regulator YafY
LAWHARFEQGVPTLTIEESQLALAALAALERIEKDATAQQALAALRRLHAILPAYVRMADAGC